MTWPEPWQRLQVVLMRKTLGLNHLAPPAAKRAQAFAGAGFRSVSAAPLAGLQRFDLQILLGAENRFFEGELQFVEQVVTRTGTGSGALSPAEVEGKKIPGRCPQRS